MRRNVLFLALALLMLAAGALFYGARGFGTSDGLVARTRDESDPGPAVLPAKPLGKADAAAPADPGAPTTRAEARAKRDTLRQKIASQLASRSSATDTVEGATVAGAASKEAPERQPPALRNRLGGREQLVSFLNREFMPLAAECIEQAEERLPALTGMLAIGIETIADEQLGAVVDLADPAPTNEVADPLLFECIRESAFSLSIPPPLTSGSEKFELTLRVGQRPAEDKPSSGASE